MIKFANLEVHDDMAISTVIEVMRSGRFISGPHNKLFAEMWAKECNADACVLTSSGTAALIAVLKMLKLRRSRYVIMPALSFAATAFAAMEVGLTPMYVDVDEHGLMDWGKAELALTRYADEVAAIIPVHLYGQILSTPPHIHERTVVLDDACQAHGVFKFDNDQPGLAAFSFYPSKNMGAVGDAGAVVFKNVRGWESRVAAYISYGDYPGEKYAHHFQGNNLRCDEIQAAYLSVAYNNLAADNLIRHAIAKTYSESGVVSLANSDPTSWHLYPILVDNPGRFNQVMRDHGVETGNHYPYTLPKVAPGLNAGTAERAEYIARHVATLPIGPHMNVPEAAQVADLILSFYTLDDGLWKSKVQ